MNKAKENNPLDKDAPKQQQMELESDYDPYLETFTSVETKPKGEIQSTIIPIITQPIIKTIPNKPIAHKYEYGYQIVLTNTNEDGLMETFINEATTEDKPRSDPSDWFNFGLDEDKWRKILNHNIIMHYEKQLMLESQNKSDQQLQHPQSQQQQQQQQMQQPLSGYNTNLNQMGQSNQVQMARQNNMYMNQYQQMQMQMQMRNVFPNQMQNYFNNQMYQQRQMFPMNTQVTPSGSTTEDK